MKPTPTPARRAAPVASSRALPHPRADSYEFKILQDESPSIRYILHPRSHHFRGRLEGWLSKIKIR